MHYPGRRKSLALATAALTATFLPTHTRAATTLTWDANLAQPGAQGGPGTWADAAGGWFNGTSNVTWNNADVDSALFTGTPAGTITLSGTVNARYLTFDTPGYTLAGGTLTFGSGAGIDSGIHATADVTINSNILTAPGVDGWLKDGPGTLTLGGNNYVAAAPFHLRSGTLAIAEKFNPPRTIFFDGDSTSRLLFTTTGQADIGPTLNVSTTATLAVQDAGATIGYVGEIRGSGSLVKLGAGTLNPTYPNASFTGTWGVNAGTLLIDRLTALNGRPISLGGGTLSLQNNTATNFASDVTARLGTGNTATLAVGGTTAPTGTNTAHALPSLTLISGTLNVTSTNGWGLTINAVTNNATIDLNNTRLTVTSSLTAFVGNIPGTIRFAHDLSVTAPNVNSRGLWLASGTNTTVTSTFAGQTEDADLLVGSTPSGTVATNLTLNGSWRGGGGSATSTLVLPPKGNITFGPNLHFNNLPTDPTAAPRPVRAWGTSSSVGGTLTFDPAFVADHINLTATPDGLASLALSNVTWETQNSQSLPVVTRHVPGSSATYRTGRITFDNFSNASAINRWTVKTNDQTYDGGVDVNTNTSIFLQKNLTHTGRVGPHADNAFQLAANRTLSLFNGHTLTLSGDLGFAPGTRVIGGDTTLVFDTDPGAGWYDGNYTRDPATGAVTTPPSPAPTLALSVGINQGPGGAVFNAPVTRLDQLDIRGTTVASLSLPGPQKVLNVATRLSFGTASVSRLDLTNNAMILGAGPNHAPGTVRAMITSGDLYSSAADADHALGYARADDVLPAAPDGSYPFLNLPATADDVLVRYTLLGDATLDGTVNFNDLLALARNYNTTNAQWSAGDFNYDDTVNFNDLLILAKHYNASLPATAAATEFSPTFSTDLAAAFAAVPEPSAAWLWISACGFALSVRRRRRSFRT